MAIDFSRGKQQSKYLVNPLERSLLLTVRTTHHNLLWALHQALIWNAVIFVTQFKDCLKSVLVHLLAFKIFHSQISLLGFHLFILLILRKQFSKNKHIYSIYLFVHVTKIVFDEYQKPGSVHLTPMSRFLESAFRNKG